MCSFSCLCNDEKKKKKNCKKAYKWNLFKANESHYKNDKMQSAMVWQETEKNKKHNEWAKKNCSSIEKVNETIMRATRNE